MRRGLLAALAALLVVPGAAAIDLAQTEVRRLENGLTVLVLEEHTLPVVSVQMLYKVGARNEAPGTTGLAHFLEHMAFRATARFPENDVVRRIYAVGGEWHGYTWIDQTTYFATAPREHLDLLLAIEAERMGALVIAAEEVEAERGAVMAELRGYEEDPATVLTESVPMLAFLQHPYRYNTIGWPSDVLAIEHADLVAFYRRHYHPANAVLAVVGDVDAGDVLARVGERFGALPGGSATPLPRTVEPPQLGERRLILRGGVDRSLYEIGYRSPAVSSPDWPAFLLLQEILGGGGGVNFRQDTFGVAVRPGSRLDGIVGETWLSPAAQPYVFTVSGSVPAGEESALEARLEAALGRLRRDGVTASELAAARQRVGAELIFDLETTEDAAHQLAFFAGLEALDVLIELEARLAGVTVEAVRDVARRCLDPRQRVIAWYVAEHDGAFEPGQGSDLPTGPAPATTATAVDRAAGPAAPTAAATASGVVGDPVLHRLARGLPAVVQRVGLSPTIHVRLLFAGVGFDGAGLAADEPLWDHSSLGLRGLADELDDALAEARRRLTQIALVDTAAPAAGLDGALEDATGVRRRSPAPPRLRAILVVGDLDPAVTRDLLERRFGDLAAEPLTADQPSRPEPDARDSAPERSGELRSAAPPPPRLAIERLPPRPSGRARLGYAVRAPAPGDPAWPAWRMLLYVLTHDYEGRLGHAAIHQRGLAYYVDSAYASDGAQAWVTFTVAAEPEKLEPLAELTLATLEDLRERPPTAAEVDEARRYLIGRRLSAAQSNEEISARLARQLVLYGAPQTVSELAARLADVTAADLERIVPAFLSGRLFLEPVEAPPPQAGSGPVSEP